MDPTSVLWGAATGLTVWFSCYLSNRVWLVFKSIIS